MHDNEKILQRLHTLGIPELTRVQALNDLPGSYINLACRLPNGQTAKILDDSKSYAATQVERTDNERCYGVAADDGQIAVYEYGCNGADAVLVAWIRL